MPFASSLIRSIHSVRMNSRTFARASSPTLKSSANSATTPISANAFRSSNYPFQAKPDRRRNNQNWRDQHGAEVSRHVCQRFHRSFHRGRAARNCPADHAGKFTPTERVQNRERDQNGGRPTYHRFRRQKSAMRVIEYFFHEPPLAFAQFTFA